MALLNIFSEAGGHGLKSALICFKYLLGHIFLNFII